MTRHRRHPPQSTSNNRYTRRITQNHRLRPNNSLRNQIMNNLTIISRRSTLKLRQTTRRRQRNTSHQIKNLGTRLPRRITSKRKYNTISSSPRHTINIILTSRNSNPHRIQIRRQQRHSRRLINRRTKHIRTHGSHTIPTATTTTIATSPIHPT